jgi:hypothetical protein
VEKYAARAVKQEIGRVLWEVWDPIGVNTYPEARDEYDNYVNDIFMLLVGGSSDEAIGKHLLQIASETMGLAYPTLEHMMPAVQALRAIRIPTDAQ